MVFSKTEELLLRLKNSDREAFNIIYKDYYAILLNYATLMVTEDCAKDIVHDVFVGLWKNRSNITIETMGGG